MTINKATLRQNIFNDVFTIVNGSVSDPSVRGKKWVYGTMPDVVSSKFSGYPFVIIKKAQVEKDNPVFDNSYSDKGTPIQITVFHTSNQTLDYLCDQIDAVMVPSNFSQFTFKDYDEDPGNVTLAGDNVHFRSMNYFVDVDTID